ncbi:hypothetical protein ACQHIV_28190 [Kribbella sp. GL6]|uniref:hypothetical protein n=1 Tax=Kribbella sp. GL6 TaxID=3419765 RepID=UPI003D006EC0
MNHQNFGADEFNADYQRVLRSASEISGPALAAEIQRLRGLVVSLADPRERRDAENDIAMLDDILAYDEQPGVSPAMARAERAHAAAMADGGSDADAPQGPSSRRGVGYQAFRAEYQRVFDVLDSQTLPDWLPAAIARLKELAADIEDPTDRRTAQNQIASIEDILDEELDGPPTSSAMMEAIRVHSRAGRGEGTPAERIARAEAGMAVIGEIAEANPSEEASILDLNEPLYMLILSLRSDRD